MRRFRRTTLITAFCLAALGGLGLSRKVNFSYEDWLVLFLPVLLLLRKKSLASFLIVISLGLLLGLWRGTIYMQRLEQLKALTGKVVTVEATATSDAVYTSAATHQLEFTVNHASVGRKPLAGNFKIRGFGVNMVYRGDMVRASGKLYTTRGSNQALMSFSQLTIISASRSTFNSAARQFSSGMQNALPEPLASFGMGLLIGQRINMPDTIKNQLTAVGLVHIVAVSGYNLTILIRGIQRVRLRSKYQQLVASLLLIFGFVTLTGYSASIVRAALVSVLSLWAWYYGLKIKSMVLLSFAAAATALANPFYIWSDLGWYLSFLAFSGVMVIAPAIQARFWQKQPKFLTIVLLETLSAELMTLPVIMMTFSQLSLVALLANLLVVPLVPAAMLFCTVAGAAGAFIPQLAGWFALPANLLLTYILDLIHLLASIPSVLVRASISPSFMIGLYGFVLVFLIGLKKNSGRNNTLKSAKI